MKVINFKYNDSMIEFDLNQDTLMVNATQMAKIFDSKVTHFIENQDTQKFILACLNSRNSDYLNIKSQDDLFTSKQKMGTFMHRVLALKFAAWLNPDFEIWIFHRIDQIVFGDYEILRKSLKASAARKIKIETLKEDIRNENPKFLELEILEIEEKQASYSRGKFGKSQIDIFKEQEAPAESV